MKKIDKIEIREKEVYKISQNLSKEIVLILNQNKIEIDSELRSKISTSVKILPVQIVEFFSERNESRLDKIIESIDLNISEISTHLNELKIKEFISTDKYNSLLKSFEEVKGLVTRLG